MRRLLTMLIALALAGAAGAQTGTSAAPQTSDVASLREEVVALDTRRANLATERVRLEADLDRLSGEIARLKAAREEASGIFSSGDLDRRLRTSRELSARIDSLSQREARVAAELRETAGRLLGAYQAAIDASRDALERSDDEAGRHAAMQQVVRLETERRAVRSGLERLEGPRPVVSGVLERTEAGSDDPEELRAQADRLRDTRDRLARQLKTLNRRMKELEHQQELENEMRSFRSEASLFDEFDRSTVRVTSSPARSGALADTNSRTADGDTMSAGTTGPGEGGTAPPAPEADFDGAGDDTAFAAGGGSEAATMTSGKTAGYSDTEGYFRLERHPSRSDSLEGAGALLQLGDSGSLEDLEERQEEIETLIRRLDRRADGLERQAGALDR